jgi:hypothetical protein
MNDQLYPCTYLGVTYSQRQSSSPFGVNEEHSRDCSQHLNSAIAQRRIQRLGRCVADIFEDGRAVERDDCMMSMGLFVAGYEGTYC